MSKVTPYLLFDGDCAEAMEFYKECLGGTVTLTKAGDSPMKAMFPPHLQDKVINAEFKSGDLQFTGSDWFHPTEKPLKGNMVCVYVSGATYEDIARYFEKLKVGAKPDTLEPIHDMPFGTYGALTDKYGVRWMFQGGKR